MSAWYIFSASGFYPVTPGRPQYELGTPLFKEIKYNLENGKTFTVKAPNVSAKNFYVKSVKLNGERLSIPRLKHEDILRGGILEFEMADAPVKVTALKGNLIHFKKRENNQPFSAVPVIESHARFFAEKTAVSLKSISGYGKIYYTTDGSEPDERSAAYKAPFVIDKTTVVKAVAVNAKVKSLVSEAKFYKKPHDWTVKILSKYNRQYTGGGDEGLIDGIRGTLNFASGEWQGYQDQDFVAVIDLKKETEIKRVGGGFLQDARPWIWMPKAIEFEASADGVNFVKVAEIKTDVAPEDMKPQIKDYFQNITPTKARFVRVKAINLGKIPSWHPGAGFDAFIFVDEIFIN